MPSRARRFTALVAASALAAAAPACTVSKNKNGSGIRLSGAGPEIVGGALITAAGVAIAYNVGAGEDQFNAQQTGFTLGVIIAGIGVIIMGHGFYRLANQPAAAATTTPPTTPPTTPAPPPAGGPPSTTPPT